MSDLARGSEPPAWIEELAAMYRQLHRISGEQKALIEDMLDAETFADRFGELVLEWNNVQSAVMQLEDRLRREVGMETFNKSFESEILPIARQIHATMVQAEERIKQGIARTGVSIHNLQHYRNARHAYAEYEDHQAIFFDEKK
jgi:hypothetical protein